MASLPILHRRRRSNKALETVETIAKAWTALNLASAGSNAAKKGVKVYGAAKGAKLVGRPVAKFALVPVAIGGGVLVWRKTRGGSRRCSSCVINPRRSRDRPLRGPLSLFPQTVFH